MSAEPARRPEDEEASAPAPDDTARGAEAAPATAAAQPAAQPDAPAPPAASAPADAPAPDEVIPPSADEPVPNPDTTLTPDAAASAEAAAAAEADPSADPASDPVAAEAAAVTTDVQTAETTAEALATIDAASDPAAAEAKAAEDAKAAADAKAERRMARRRAVGGAVRTVLTLVFGLALFVGGIAIGNYIFAATRPAPTGLTGDPGVTSQAAPPAAQEFIAALAVNDADSIRSSLDQAPHIDLTNEMTKYGIQHIDSVDVLGTSVDGKRSATEILMHYQREDGIPFAINLVILVNDGKIEGFR
jgi:hypothetical protein